MINFSLRRFVFSLITGAFLIFLSHNASAQYVHTYTTTDSVFVGDTFTFSLVLQLDAEFDHIAFPDTNLLPPTIESIGRQQFKLSPFTDSLAYKLQFFGSSDVTIPPLPVTVITGQDSTIVYSQPVTIHFKSLVAEGDTSIKPLKPVFDFPRLWWPWILVAILLAIFLIWWFKFREQSAPEHSKPLPQFEPFYNPLQELENTLVAIKKEAHPAKTGDFKLFYSSVSDAIRKYFEELYLIPALESTTRELSRYLDVYGVDQEMVALNRRILQKADLVKFAKFTPTLDDAQATYQLSIDFLVRAKQADAMRISRLRDQYEAQFKPKNKEAVE